MTVLRCTLSRTLLPALLLLASYAPAAWAWRSQAERVTITGSVSDPSGAGLPRVSLEFRNSRGEIAARAQTNAVGEFKAELPPGRYALSARLAGFAPVDEFAFDAAAGTPPLNLSLAIPEIVQSIVVTATRTETVAPQVGATVTVLSGDELAREGVATATEALRRVAGLTVVQSGAAGQVASLFVRGGESDYTKVLLDGIEINDPGGAVNLSNLSITGIDRIEVIRGPQSALFGSDAISGVVQIFTRRGTAEGLTPHPTLQVEGGTFGTFRYSAGVQGKGDRMDYSLTFSRSDTDNNVLNGSFNDAALTANLGFRLSDKTEIRTVLRSDAGRAGVPGPWAFRRPDPDEYYRHMDYTGGLSLTHQGNRVRQVISYSMHDSRQLSVNPFDAGSFVSEFNGVRAPYMSFDYPYETLNDTRRQKFSYQSDWIMGRGHLLTAGADYERQSGVVGDPALDPLRATRDNAAAYVQDQWSVRDRVFTSAGVRLDRNGSFGFFASPRLSVALHARKAAPGRSLGLTKIKANFGLGMKEPTLVESFSNSPYFRGNPDLRPERSASFDVGVEQQIGSGRSAVELNYFESWLRDQIAFITTDYTTFEGTFLNLGRSRAKGIETIFRQELGGGWHISGGYTFLNSRVVEATSSFDPAFQQGQSLFRRPRHSGYVDARWTRGRWTLSASEILMGSRVDSDFSGLGFTRNAGYAMLNVTGSLRLRDSLTIFAGGYNFCNAGGKRCDQPMEVLGYPMLRAHFRLGIRAGL